MTWCSIDGTLRPLSAAAVSISDRGWSLADGCFETIRVHAGRALWLDAHLARLRQGLATLAIPAPPTLATLSAELRRLCDRLELRDGLARVQISRGVQAQRGLAWHAPTPTSVITAAAAAPWPSAPAVRLALVAQSTRRNEWSPLSRCKCMASYPDQLLALDEARRAGADDALIRNTAGELACTCVGNLWLVLDGVLVTPPVAAGAVPGVVRQHILAHAAAWGLAAQVARLTLEQLARASEVFSTNVGYGVAQLQLITAERSPAPVSMRVLQALRATADADPTSD